MKPLRLSSLATLVLLAASALPVKAQITVGAPSSASIKPCDEFFTDVLNNPVDMAHSSGPLADVNNYFLGTDIFSFSSAALGNGTFSGVTASEGATFYLWSPMACGSYPVGGRWGAKANSDFEDAIRITPAMAAKYRSFSMRMKHPSVNTNLGPGYRLLLDRDCNYNGTRTGTLPKPVVEGWATYIQDLPTASLYLTNKSWLEGDITGFAIQPTQQSNSSVQISNVRLEDPASCSNLSVTIPYTITAAGNNDRAVFVLDDNSDPFDGYYKVLSGVLTAGSGNLSLSDTLGLPPGRYNTVGVLDSDFATLVRLNPWDFNETTDIVVTGSVNNASLANGTISGSTATTDANIFMSVPTAGIDASQFKKFSIKVSRSNTSQPIRLIWDTGFQDLTDAVHRVGNTDVYQVDLGANAGWTGTIKTFIVRPSILAGVTFSVDWVSIRATGYDTDRSTSSVTKTAGATQVVIDHKPLLAFHEPDVRGGDSIRPWNMRQKDFVLYQNLRTDADPAFPGESYTTFLPDVRTVFGLRGDFFKGTNVAGNDDPTNYSNFPLYNDNPLSFSASEYKQLCYKLAVDRTFDLGLGSVARILWRVAETATFYTTEDIVSITDRWAGSPWYEYCVDLSRIHVDANTLASLQKWEGTIDAFRVDAHEFSRQSADPTGNPDPNSAPLSVSYYFDYIKVSKPDTSTGAYSIVYEVTDSDHTSPTVTFFYTTSKSATGGTQISASDLSCEGQVCIWNTQGMANGDYYIYGVASDGVTTNSALATGMLRIRNDGSTGAEPILELEAPTSSTTACDSLQVKGFSLPADRNERIAAVQVFVNDTFVDLIRPQDHSPQAVSKYPTLDSSNTGFNLMYDVSAFPANNPLEVKVVAYSAQGVKKTVGPLSLSRGSCSTPISDPDPAGVPLAPDGGFLPTPTPTPVVPGPGLKAPKLAADGTFTMSVSQVGATDCTINLFAGASATTVDTLIKSFPVTAANAKKGSMTLQAKKITVNKKKLKAAFFQATKTCTSGGGTVRSSVVSFKPKTATGKIKSLQQFITTLRKGLKAK